MVIKETVSRNLFVCLNGEVTPIPLCLRFYSVIMTLSVRRVIYRTVRDGGFESGTAISAVWCKAGIYLFQIIWLVGTDREHPLFLGEGCG